MDDIFRNIITTFISTFPRISFHTDQVSTTLIQWHLGGHGKPQIGPRVCMGLIRIKNLDGIQFIFYIILREREKYLLEISRKGTKARLGQVIVNRFPVGLGDDCTASYLQTRVVMWHGTNNQKKNRKKPLKAKELPYNWFLHFDI